MCSLLWSYLSILDYCRNTVVQHGMLHGRGLTPSCNSVNNCTHQGSAASTMLEQVNVVQVNDLMYVNFQTTPLPALFVEMGETH